MRTEEHRIWHVLLSAAALLDLDVMWLFPEQQDSILSCAITAESLDKTLFTRLSPENGTPYILTVMV